MRLPDFCLPAVRPDGKEFTLCDKDLRGRWTVLYVYPKDNTPGCTTEAKEFSELADEFESLGVDVVGISRDSIRSHRKFIERHSLRVTLLSDKEAHLIRKLGAWGRKRGKEGVIRSTFIVNPDLEVVWHAIGVRPRGHAAEVLKVVKELLG